MSVVCIDCRKEGVTNVRVPALYRGKPVAGSRCVTHHRAKKKSTRERNWETRLLKVYGLTAAMYWAIYELQGGVCYICRRAKGDSKKLSVDHCHKTGLIRGLLCAHCNRDILGHLRDEIAAFLRGAEYLREPPASRLGIVVVAPVHYLTQNEEEEHDADGCGSSDSLERTG